MLSPAGTIQLSEKQIQICGVVRDLNMIKPFPMSEPDIIEWTNTIVRLRPKATPEDIGKVMDNFLTGEWDYDKEIGIQNIFKGLDELNRDRPYNFVEV